VENNGIDKGLRFEADDRPSLPLTIGLGLQNTALTLAGVVLTPTILITTAGASDAYLNWALFAALAVSGLATFIQAMRFGRIGAGYILVMGSTTAYLAVGISAVRSGGPELMATLIVVAAFTQFILGSRMAMLRRVFTPTVAGTVLMLIPVSIAPIIYGKLINVPATVAPAAAPVTALVTLAASVLLALRLSGIWRLWAPAIGLVSGSLAGAAFGIYDTARIAAAPWIGLPDFSAYPGLDLSFDATFWALLPGFILVTLVGALDTLGDAIAIQRVSWRKPRATDFRSIQGAIYADGVGNLLSGLGGTVPNTTYGNCIAVVEITGVAARRVGVCVGVVFALLAFLPKIVAVVVAIPGPVVGAYLAVIMALIFVLGLRIVIADGFDYRKRLIVGFAVVVGVLFQFDLVYPALQEGAWGEILGQGMTVGGITVILLSGFVDLTRSRPRRLRTTLSVAAVPAIDAFLHEFAQQASLDERTTFRLRAVGEEVLHILLDDRVEEAERDLLLIARADGMATDLEFIAGGSEINLEDQLAMLSEGGADLPNESEVPLRLLRHYATSVRHQQYHGTDIATIRIEPEGAPRGETRASS